jgi:hypothetical protein
MVEYLSSMSEAIERTGGGKEREGLLSRPGDGPDSSQV